MVVRRFADFLRTPYPLPSRIATSRARSSFGSLSSSAPSVSKLVAFAVSGLLVQAAVQASEGVGVSC